MVFLTTILDGGKKRKRKEPEIPDDLTEEEKRFIYKNPQGKIIFTPLYEVYNETYMREVVAGVNIKGSYSKFNDTSWFEKYTANLYQFSAARSVEKAKAMQSAVYDADGKLRSWSKFKTAADEIQHTQNKIWLRVERDNCQRQAIMAQKFTDMREDADLYPYWRYSGRLDSRERPEHRALEGLILRIGDPAGDALFPPSDWNCRCTGIPVDDLYLRDRNRVVQTNEQAKGWLEGIDPEDGKPFVDPQFRYNPADQGMLPKIGDQFVDFKNANMGNADLFDISGPDKPELNASVLENLPGIIADWKDKYHVDRLGNICFQNAELLSNIWFTPHSANNIHGHPRGVNALPETLSDPSEVWMKWEDPIKQQITMRSYLSYTEKSVYVVNTRAGAVQDAFTTSHHGAQKYRTGVCWIK